MALDRNFSLHRLPPPVAGLPVLPRDFSAPPETGCALIPADRVPALAEAGWRDLTLAIAADWRQSLTRALGADWTGANPYELLERHGLAAVSPTRPEDGRLILSGGSYSQVSLHCRTERLVVCKQLEVDGPMTRDRELRQLQECDWLARLPGPAKSLFPTVLETVRSDSRLELLTEFDCGYTLAELVFQGRLDAKGLADLLVRVYAEVSTRMWSRPAVDLPTLAPAENYLQRIRRRTGTILASDYPADGAARYLLEAPSVVVNGRRCLGLEPLLATLEADPSWDRVIDPEQRCLCHGDLILEDIVVSRRAPAGFRLLDPNPVNANPIYDLGKTMMSLWLGYELLYFDRFSLEWELTAAGPALAVKGGEPAIRQLLLAGAERFMAHVRTELAPHLQLEPEELERGLRMSAALHMLAITVFHLLHHRREERALAFAATGLLHAQAALEDTVPGD